MKAMTYGTLPAAADFSRAFNKLVGRDNPYIIRGDKHLGDVGLHKKELWMLVKKLSRIWSSARSGRIYGDRINPDDAGDLASALLYTLGFEWI